MWRRLNQSAMWTCQKCGESLEDQFESCWKCAGEVQKIKSTRGMVWWFLLPVVILLQSILVLNLTVHPVNLYKASFRSEQRAAALTAMIKDRSPEHKAAYNEEVRLTAMHIGEQQLIAAGIFFLFFLFIDALVFYPRKQCAQNKTLSV